MAKRKAVQPWEHAAPKNARHNRLSPARKTAAKRRAKRAGRTYPNLVDNMYEATQSPGRKKAKKR